MGDSEGRSAEEEGEEVATVLDVIHHHHPHHLAVSALASCARH